MVIWEGHVAWMEAMK